MTSTVMMQSQSKMNNLDELSLFVQNNRANEISIGFFFILAAVTSIIGLILYGPILDNPEYVISGNANNQIITGATLELGLIISAIGTSVSLYPYLKRYNESLALAHVLLRLFEMIFVAIGALSLLAIVGVNTYIHAGNSIDEVSAISVAQFLLTIHKYSFMLGPNFMLAFNTFLYSYIFFKTKILPRGIAILGLYASISILLTSFLELYGIIDQMSTIGGILSLPIGLTEMSVALYCLLNGFRQPMQ